MKAVEHRCPCCNSAVEQGSAFCPSCGAAQIRFAGREHPREPVGVSSATMGPSAFLERAYSRPSTIPSRARAELRAALYAGLIAAFLGSIPLGANFILALPLAGYLSVLFYRRSAPTPDLEPAAAFRLGALSGLFGFLTLLMLTAIGTLTFHAQSKLREAMLQAVRQAQERAGDPAARQMLDYFSTPPGVAFLMIFGFILLGIVFVVLSGAGALVSAAVLRHKRPPKQ
jgi:hypothetical protein